MLQYRIKRAIISLGARTTIVQIAMGARIKKAEIRGFVVIICAVLLWECAVRVRWINGQILPSPWHVLLTIVDLIKEGYLFSDIIASIVRVMVGFTIAAVVAIPLGIIAGWDRRCAVYITPGIELLRPIPPIAWIPMAILWFGIHNPSSYFITGIASFFPIFLSAYTGARAVERVHIHAASCLGARGKDILSTVIFPSALPYVISGMRIGLGVAWMSVIAAELIAAQSGLGYMIQLNRMLLDTKKVFAGMVIIGCIGSAMNKGMMLIYCKLIPWKSGTGR